MKLEPAALRLRSKRVASKPETPSDLPSLPLNTYARSLWAGNLCLSCVLQVLCSDIFVQWFPGVKVRFYHLREGVLGVHSTSCRNPINFLDNRFCEQDASAHCANAHAMYGTLARKGPKPHKQSRVFRTHITSRHERCYSSIDRLTFGGRRWSARFQYTDQYTINIPFGVVD